MRVWEDMGRVELASGLIADARGVVWLPGFRTLVAADVHLGFVWVERRRGALLPLVEEDAPWRLRELAMEYRADDVVLLGDTLHATARPGELAEELAKLVDALAGVARVSYVLGNHDERLEAVLSELGCRAECARELRMGPHLLVHGHAHDWESVRHRLGRGGVLIYGHEHPALVLGDGVATSVKVPCFLCAERRFILPAFSRWAAGITLGRQPMMSRLARTDEFERAVAVLGDRLLPVPLENGMVTGRG